MAQLLIALTSTRGRSGKDTLIEELEKAGHKVHRVAFGDILKVRCAEELGLELDNVYPLMHTDLKDVPRQDLSIDSLVDSGYSEWLRTKGLDGTEPRSPRWHLQQYGTDYRRNYLNDQDVWLREGIDRIKRQPKYGIVVVTDLRQRNEYIALSNLLEQGYTARMVRIQRMWNVPGVDDVEYHVTDLDLIGFFMSAVVLNEWGEQAAMVTQLREQGIDV